LSFVKEEEREMREARSTTATTLHAPLMAPNPYIKAINAASTASPSADKKQKKERKSKSAKTTSATDADKGKGKAVDEVLRAEILALGGDEEDLNLLADVGSDSEIEESGDQENAVRSPSFDRLSRVAPLTTPFAHRETFSVTSSRS
jgi:hypothetical protein